MNLKQIVKSTIIPAFLLTTQPYAADTLHVITVRNKAEENKKAEGLYRHATKLFEKGNIDYANEVLFRLINKFPTSERADDALYLEIKCRIAQNAAAGAENLLDELESFHPNSPYIEKAKSEIGPGFIKSGESEYRNKKYKLALEYFKKASEYEPQNSEIFNRIGDTYRHISPNFFEQALKNYYISIRLNPKEGHSYAGIGSIFASRHFKRQNKQKAYEVWKKGAELGDPYCIKNLKNFERISIEAGLK